jgi:hypothetical protein
MSVFSFIFDKGTTDEETINLTCVQDFDPYNAPRRVASLKMIDGTAYQDSGFDVTDGTINLSGNLMYQAVLDELNPRYEGSYQEFDFISMYTGTSEAWLVNWNTFTARPNIFKSQTYTFSVVLNVISKY